MTSSPPIINIAHARSHRHLVQIALTLGVAAAYALSGWVSLQIGVPPYQVSWVFIPAGIALGAALAGPSCVLGGIAAGSLIVQLLALGAVTRWVSEWEILIIAPLGATLQAYLSAKAIRHWSAYPSHWDDPLRSLLFLLVLIPLGHTLNATVSVFTLVNHGTIDTQEAWTAWAAWWLGDTLGAVLLTPIALVLFGQPRHIWWPRWKTLALPMSIALVVVVVVFLQIQTREHNALELAFEQQSKTLTERLQRRLDAQTDATIAVARVMEVMQSHDASHFQKTTAGWLERYPGMQNFGWSPLVTAAQRPAFERLAAEAFRMPYTILGRNAEGHTFTAPDAPTYLPLRYVEPLQGNRSALGVDVLALPSTAQAVKRTIASGLPQATEGFRLVQESGEQRGVVLYLAVHHNGSPSAFSPEGHVLGVVSAVFRMDDVLEATVGAITQQGLHPCLLDPGARNDRQWLAGVPKCDSKAAQTATFFSSLPVQFGERTWLFQIAADRSFVQHSRNWGTWAVLGFTLVVVALLGSFLLVVSGHNRRIEALVEQRTLELARINSGLQEMALFDPLTGLANRLHWMNEARKALDAAQRHGDHLAVAFIDLDHFKEVNDTHGHHAGDLLLQSVSQRLQSCLRSHDLMARQGGDEFVVLLNRLRSRDDAAAVAQKMVHVLSEPFNLKDRVLRISASVGLEWFEGGPEDLETLLRHADVAMYRAKAAGRNDWCFFRPDMDQSATQKLLVEGGLRRAIAKDELRLHYQPQVDCSTGAIVGAEALVRWHHHVLGLLTPDRFIPQAENTGQMEELGGWVLRRACEQWVKWTAMGLNAKLAVNVSATEFARPTFVPRLRQILQDTGLNPLMLELEITETALMKAFPELTEQLEAIASMGIHLSLDDFGTGYSSLGYLKRLPLHRIKIDRSFVRDVPGNKEDEAIVKATLSMAHALGLEVVAEGVERPQQRDYLDSLDCDQIQGWLVARPMDAAMFEAWWQRQYKL
ncbi:MAG: hypothetical protein RLZZ612_2242 [Pseudomonadota bacterium]